ncbi:MAG: short-chain dehydrogenase [Armatimonadota bacterium]|nr:MAG: short-chain dehydrogenase [Armatimonadota bacterium]
MRRVLVVGATSPLARYMAHEFARLGDTLFLAGRDMDELQRVASDVQVRFGASVHTGRFDAAAVETHEAFWQEVLRVLGGLDGVVWVAGTMDGLEEAFREPQAVRRLIDVNFTGAASLLTLAACYFEEQSKGFIAGVSSVAGDRGRAQNYPYGAAKGGLSLFLQGLRNRLSKRGVQVTTLKPGFIDTRMTWGRDKLPFLASPQRVAKESVQAILQGKDVAYVPAIWWLVMLVIRSIPEKVFKRMNI